MTDEAVLRPITVACPDCDLLNDVPELAPGESASCVRCNGTLSRNPTDSVERCLALAFAAAVLFIIANTFPFLSFGKQGIVTETTLASGVIGLFQEGMYFLAAVVAYTTIVVPALVLGGLFYILLPLQFGRRLPGWEAALKVILHLRPWNMVEIFLIGIIVAGIKLYKMASLVPGLSAWSFVALVIILTLISSVSEPRVFWERLESAHD